MSEAPRQPRSANTFAPAAAEPTANAVPATTVAVLAAAAARHPDRLAIVDGHLRLTFAELAAEVQRATRALIASGIEPGDRVSIWLPNTHHWIVATLALHSAGAALVPLNTRYTGSEAHDILLRSSSRALITGDRFLRRDYLATLCEADAELAPADRDAARPVPGLPALELVVQVPLGEQDPATAPGAISWDDLLARAAEVTPAAAAARAAAVGPDDVCDVLFTSGTTGRPKGAMSAHRQTIGVAEAWATCGEVVADDVYLLTNPFFHSFGYKAGFLVCLLRGATIVPQTTFDVDVLLDAIERHRISVIAGPPTIFQTLLAHPEREQRRLDSLRLAVTGAAMVPVALVERMRSDLTFQAVVTAYGLTEAAVVTMCRPADDPETISRTSGCATADFEIRIAAPDGTTLAPHEDGEVLLRGPNVMLGYLDDAAATAEAIDADAWLHTGDVGHLDERGYLTITDRIKNMFTVGGFNVYPAEIEQVIARLTDVIESAVIGVPDERLGEVGAAYVIPRPGATLTEDDVIAQCRRHLANFKVPRTVELVAELPRNATGKVLKTELRAAVTERQGA